MRQVLLALAVALAIALGSAGLLVVPTLDGTWRGAMTPPGALRLGLAAVAGVTTAWLLRRQAPSVREPLLLLALAGLPLVPVLTGQGLLLLAFQDRTLVLIASAAGAAAVVAFLRATRRPTPRVPVWALALAAFVAYAALASRIPGRAGPQGDEPQYLLLAHSLLHDGDLDLANQFAERQYQGFYGGTLEPHASAASPPGTVYLTHAPGLGLMIAPGYALGGYRGAVLFLCALVAMGVALLRNVVLEATGDEWLALGTWAVVALTPPVAVFALALYPETAAVAALGLLLWLRLGTPGWAAGVLAGLVGGGMTWLHPKMLPLGALAFALVWLRLPGRRAKAIALLAWAAAAGSFLAYMRVVFGRATLSAGFGDPHLSASNLPWGVLAQLFDRQSGLLVVAPVLALALFGILPALRARLRETLALLALAGLPLAIGGAYGDWAAGICPPGRYPLPAVVPGAVLLAVALARRPRLGAALAGTGAGILLVATRVPPVLRTATPGEGHLLRELSPVDLNAVFPSFVVDAPSSAVLIALGLLAALTLAWRFGAVGLAAGACACALVGPVLTQRAPIHPAATTLRALHAWNGPIQQGPRGPLDPARLLLPQPLLGGYGVIAAGEVRRTRRTVLPPGAYELRIEAPGVAPRRARVELRSNDLSLGETWLQGGDPLVLPIALPSGAPGFGFSIWAEQGETQVTGAWLRPVAVLPRSERGELAWARRPHSSLYRLERGPLRVTLAEGFDPDGDVFRLGGGAKVGLLVLDGPPAAVARVSIARIAANASDSVEVLGRAMELGSALERTLDVPLSRGRSLGPLAVLAVRVRAPGASVRVEPVAAR